MILGLVAGRLELSQWQAILVMTLPLMLGVAWLLRAFLNQASER